MRHILEALNEAKPIYVVRGMGPSFYMTVLICLAIHFLLVIITLFGELGLAFFLQ